MRAQKGHCIACDARIWRGLVRPDTQEWVPLFPDPTSLYALLETEEGIGVGLGYCKDCAPPIGSDGPIPETEGRPLGPSIVVGFQPATVRYASRFSDRYGHFLHVWTRELSVEFKTPESEWEPLLAQWREDRLVCT